MPEKALSIVKEAPRENSPAASGGSVTISGSAIVAALLVIVAIIAIVVAVRAEGKADRAIDQAMLMERETRIMQDDLKFIRAFLSARGIEIPANHHEAEEK